MTLEKPYVMSFSLGGLNLHESLIVANAYLLSHDWDQVRDVILKENLFQTRMASSSKRLLNEIISRIRQMSEEEMQLFCTGNDQDQRHLLWLAICRRYEFIRDFYQQIVQGHWRALKERVTNDDFNLFWAQKRVDHPEVERISNLTKEKLRSVVFRIMREVSLISKDNHINNVVLSSAVHDLIIATDSSHLSLFTTLDSQGGSYGI